MALRQINAQCLLLVRILVGFLLMVRIKNGDLFSQQALHGNGTAVAFIGITAR